MCNQGISKILKFSPDLCLILLSSFSWKFVNLLSYIEYDKYWPMPASQDHSGITYQTFASKLITTCIFHWIHLSYDSMVISRLSTSVKTVASSRLLKIFKLFHNLPLPDVEWMWSGHHTPGKMLWRADGERCWNKSCSN